MPAPTDRIDALLYPMDSRVSTWHTSGAPPLAMSYQFAGTSQPADLTFASFAGWTAFTANEIAVVNSAFQELETFVNIDFTQVSGQADPDINLGRVGLGTQGQGGFNYSFSFNGQGQVTSRTLDSYAVWGTGADITTAANRDFVLHEIGHALTLKHPGNYDVGGNFPPGPFLSAAEDNNRYTVMSYNAADNGLLSDHYMLYDIAALQARFGANMNYHTGADNYTGSSTSNFCIWDAGGTDTITGSSGNDVINLNEGTFSSILATNNLSIAYNCVIENASGGAGNDLIIGNGLANILLGGGGDDTFESGGGVDSLFGEIGSDFASYRNSATAVTVDLNAQNSWDGSAVDFFTSIENAIGSALSDTLFGSSSDNILEGLGGVDFVQGNGGNDTASYRSSTHGVTVDLNAQNSWDGTSMDFLSSIENAIGSGLTDTLLGNAGDNILEGLGGVDFIQGGSAGSDTASYRSAVVGVQVDLQSQYSWDGTSMDFYISIENAIGSAQSDTLVGSSGDNIFEGLGGIDFIQGGGGSDTASYRSSTTAVAVDLVSQYSWDGTSTDFFNSIENAIGSAQADNLFGSSGVNRLEGLAGNDVMTSNGGNDFFRFAEVGTGADTITDFDADAAGGQDLIDVSGRGFSAGSIGGAIIITSLGGGASTLITIGADAITLTGVNAANVTAADFVF